jgi:hypothetical protein
MDTEQLEFLVLYLQSRNSQNWGWVGYKIYKVLISYISGVKDIDTLRAIFEKLMSLGYFEKRKIKSKTEYRFIFSPHAPSVEP